MRPHCGGHQVPTGPVTRSGCRGEDTNSDGVGGNSDQACIHSPWGNPFFKQVPWKPCCSSALKLAAQPSRVRMRAQFFQRRQAWAPSWAQHAANRANIPSPALMAGQLSRHGPQMRPLGARPHHVRPLPPHGALLQSWEAEAPRPHRRRSEAGPWTSPQHHDSPGKRFCIPARQKRSKRDVPSVRAMPCERQTCFFIVRIAAAKSRLPCST